MTETWQCGNCPLVVGLPDERTNPEGYADTLTLIGEHRLGHMAQALMSGDPRALLGLLEDKPSGFDMGCQPVTKDDVIPALAEADRLVRGGRP